MKNFSWNNAHKTENTILVKRLWALVKRNSMKGFENTTDAQICDQLFSQAEYEIYNNNDKSLLKKLSGICGRVFGGKPYLFNGTNSIDGGVVGYWYD